MALVRAKIFSTMETLDPRLGTIILIQENTDRLLHIFSNASQVATIAFLKNPDMRNDWRLMTCEVAAALLKQDGWSIEKIEILPSSKNQHMFDARVHFSKEGKSVIFNMYPSDALHLSITFNTDQIYVDENLFIEQENRTREAMQSQVTISEGSDLPSIDLTEVEKFIDKPTKK